MNLAQIHEATEVGDQSAKSFIGSALDCILLANEYSETDDVREPALTQAMVYAQLATAAATMEAANVTAKSNYDGRI